MPRGNFRRQKNLRRRGRNRRRGFVRRRRRNNFINFRGHIMPEKFVTTLVYSELFNRNTGTTFDEYVYTGNGLFDPNVTGSGGQPDGFDQFALFYSRYRVVASSVTLTITNDNSNGNLYMALFPSLSSGGVTGYTDAKSQPYAVFKSCGPPPGQVTCNLSKGMSTSRIWGQPANSDDLFTALFSANPNNLWYWIFNAACVGSTLNYDISITIRYRVQFYKRLSLDQS